MKFTNAYWKLSNKQQSQYDFKYSISKSFFDTFYFLLLIYDRKIIVLGFNFLDLIFCYCWNYTLRKKIRLLHLERIVKHFLNFLTRNIDFLDIRIPWLNRWNDRAFLVQNFLGDETKNSATNRLNCEKLSIL